MPSLSSSPVLVPAFDSGLPLDTPYCSGRNVPLWVRDGDWSGFCRMSALFVATGVIPFVPALERVCQNHLVLKS
jgi:hypothetical protein